MTAIRTLAGDGRKAGALTRDDVIETLQEYARRFGEGDLTAAAFSPSSAKWGGRLDLRDRYYNTTREDGRKWPSLNAIKKLFDGSFNAAREAAGFAANTPGPAKRRRAAGEAGPIRDIREHVVVVPSERAREATRRAASAEARLVNAQRRIEQLRVDLAEAKTHRPVAREVRVVPQTITKTITRTVKVKDERQVEHLRSKLADAEAGRRAEAEQARAAARDRDRALRDVESIRAETARALAAAELRAARAQRALAAAELRAARAERELAGQAAAITGELRKLTPPELAELRQAGPAGPTVLAAALKQLGAARTRNHDLAVALTAIAQAAITWRDRL